MIKIDFEHKMARSFGFQLFLVLTNSYVFSRRKAYYYQVDNLFSLKINLKPEAKTTTNRSSDNLHLYKGMSPLVSQRLNDQLIHVASSCIGASPQ